MSILLIDGVKYEEWTPPSEDEFERVVKEHTRYIFGEQSIYLDRKQKLKSLSGIGSIPDGYVIVFGVPPHWHIVEVELSSHPLHDHIVSQIGRFISGISNPNIQRGIVNAIDEEIARDDFVKLQLRKAIEPTEIYRFLSDIISKQPILTIIIDKDTEELRESLNVLRYPQIKVVEFQTFTREGIGLSVHSHLFEPLYKPVVATEPQPSITPVETVEIVLAPSCMKYYYIHIPAAKKHLFPTFKTTLELETDIGPIESGFGTDPAWGAWLQKGLSGWFKEHPELKPGDKLIIEVIEPMKRYRLRIT